MRDRRNHDRFLALGPLHRYAQCVGAGLRMRARLQRYRFARRRSGAGPSPSPGISACSKKKTAESPCASAPSLDYTGDANPEPPNCVSPNDCMRRIIRRATSTSRTRDRLIRNKLVLENAYPPVDAFTACTAKPLTIRSLPHPVRGPRDQRGQREMGHVRHSRSGLGGHHRSRSHCAVSRGFNVRGEVAVRRGRLRLGARRQALECRRQS